MGFGFSRSNRDQPQSGHQKHASRGRQANRLGCGAAMTSDLDIWRAANLLIRKHGANAELEAAKRADLMLDRGDDDGRSLWTRIRRAVEALQAPPSGRLN